VAFDALRAVNADGAYANLVLAKLLTERGLTGRDAAFATELLATYDAIITAAAGRSLTSLQPAVVDLLRLGSHQLLSMRVPLPAAVTAMVDLAAATVGERVTGVVNAVLRKVAAADLANWLDRLSTGLDEWDRLALVTAHPRWIVAAYADRLPAAELEPALRADNLSPAVSLAVRPGLTDVAELLRAGARPGRHSPYAAAWSGNPAELDAVRSGRAGVQDEGSQLVTLGLARATAEPGAWLDLCAGPGGKTALLTGLAAVDGSRVLAAELAPHRAELVAAGSRAYEHPPTVVVADSTRPSWRPGVFTRVLADVPCSGLGALRRRPESRWRRTPETVEELHPLQLALLDSALAAVRSGGVVAYVTCSPHRHETADVVEQTLARRNDVSVIAAGGLFGELEAATEGPYLQLWPHRHGTDAMFAAYLRRA